MRVVLAALMEQCKFCNSDNLGMLIPSKRVICDVDVNNLNLPQFKDRSHANFLQLPLLIPLCLLSFSRSSRLIVLHLSNTKYPSINLSFSFLNSSISSAKLIALVMKSSKKKVLSTSSANFKSNSNNLVCSGIDGFSQNVELITP